MEQILTAAEIKETAQELLDWLDADTFPQSRSACDWIIQSNGEAEMAQKYADLLAAGDGRQELPNRVGDFIIALYETEITRRAARNCRPVRSPIIPASTSPSATVSRSRP